MKYKLSLIIFFLFLSVAKLMAQSPAMINYQGVAVTAAGAAIANQNVAIQASIRQATAYGTILYSEVRTVMTDADGFFNLQIGGPGTSSIAGYWSTINWVNGNKFLQIEIDPANGTNFVNMGSRQLVSVPYAEYANKAGALTPTATINPNQINPGGAFYNDVLKFNGTNWAPSVDISDITLPYSVYNYTPQSFKISNNANGTAFTGETGTGNAVVGECTGNAGNGIRGLAYGTSNNPIGVYGEAANGTAVKGYANNAGSTAVFGSSLAGTGVKATSFTGTALDVVGDTKLTGDLKISGGNTNPMAGAVLTSDASGNAVWKKNKIGFVSTYNTNQTINNATVTPLQFNDTYDPSGILNPWNAAVDPNTFIAPVSGTYKLMARANLHLSSFTFNLFLARIEMEINGVTNVVSEANAPEIDVAFSQQNIHFNEDVHLNAGDKVTLSAYIVLFLGSSATILSNKFSGHLVSED